MDLESTPWARTKAPSEAASWSRGCDDPCGKFLNLDRTPGQVVDMRSALLMVAMVLAGCESKKSTTPPEHKAAMPAASAEAPLGDLSTSLAAVRTTFNAHRGEPRFLTLLSPT